MAKDYSHLIGEKRGLLTVTGFGKGRNGKTQICTMLYCTCDCGKQTVYRPERFIKFEKPSCGCQVRARFYKVIEKDGRTKYPEYHVWWDMIRRCHK